MNKINDLGDKLAALAAVISGSFPASKTANRNRPFAREKPRFHRCLLHHHGGRIGASGPQFHACRAYNAQPGRIAVHPGHLATAAQEMPRNSRRSERFQRCTAQRCLHRAHAAVPIQSRPCRSGTGWRCARFARCHSRQRAAVDAARSAAATTPIVFVIG